jgi:uncharacterized protein (DUF2062 family)
VRYSASERSNDVDKLAQIQALLEERNALNRQLDYITEKAVRAQYIRRIAAIGAQIEKMRNK